MSGSVQPAEHRQRQLKQVLGPIQLFTLGFGSIIGVGWIVAVGWWLDQAGTLGAIAAFFLGGAAIAVIAACYAELSARYPGSGGEIDFAAGVFGRRAAGVVGWLLAFVYLSVCAFEAVSLGWILETLTGFASGAGESNSVAIAIAATAALTLVHLKGAAPTSLLQDWATWLFVAICAVFMVAAFSLGQAERMRPLLPAETGTVAGILAVAATAPFWYSGFAPVAQAVGERRDDAVLSRMRFLLVGTIAASFVFYALVILAVAVSRSPSGETQGGLLAASAVTSTAGPIMGKLVLVAGLLGLITTWNAVFFASTRVLLALPFGGGFERFFSYVHPRSGTPRNAVLFVAAVTVAASIFGKSAIPVFVNAASIGMALVYILACAALFTAARRLRERRAILLGAAGLLLATLLALLALYGSLSTASTKLAPELLALLAWLGIGLFIVAISGWQRRTG